MFTFYDLNNNKVELSFGGPSFPMEPRHVLVLVQRDGKWLCALNEKRGVEFPGGKVEPGETLVEAAKREVYEETFVHIKDLKLFAHYMVYAQKPFCKVVYLAKVEKIDPFLGQYETTGRLFLTMEEAVNHPYASFYMKDEGMKMMMQEVKKLERKWQH